MCVCVCVLMYVCVCLLPIPSHEQDVRQGQFLASLTGLNSEFSSPCHTKLKVQSLSDYLLLSWRKNRRTYAPDKEY